jgi:hypothetical protein
MMIDSSRRSPPTRDSGCRSLLGITLTTLTFAMTLDRILNGLTRPFFGWCPTALAAR